MSELTLKPFAPLTDIESTYEGCSIRQITDRALVSVSTPLGGEKKLAANVMKSYGTKIPKTGQSTTGNSQNIQLLGLQPDQLFLYFTYDGNDPVEMVEQHLGDAGYYCDQSDSWVIIALEGPNAHLALERICSLDLHPDVLIKGAVTRTQMEHLGVIVYRSGLDEFTLFSARSSAKSFHHAIITSIKNVTT